LNSHGNFTIFDDVAKDENTLTALLRNYLRHPAFSNDVLKLFGAADESLSDKNFSNVKIQYSIGENGRPDLTFITGDTAIYVEIKTNNFRGITDNQPLGYINGLIKEKVKHRKLVFLIPEDYYYTDLIEQKLVDKPKEVNVSILYWEKIIDIIVALDLHNSNLLFKEYHAFLEYWFKPKKIIFMPTEIKKVFDLEFANGIDKTIKLINNVTSASAKYFKKSFERKSVAFYEQGFYLSKEDYVLFVGFWLPSWRETGHPFCICLCDNSSKGNKEVFKAISKKHKLVLETIKEEGYDENYLCAFFRSEDLTNTNNLNHIMSIVKDFASNWDLK
jgi:hypothetical protein